MTKKILTTLFLVSLVGCAHVHVADWNATTGEVTVCGNRWADGKDLREEAQKGCNGNLVAEHGFVSNTGIAWQATGSGSGYAYNTSQGCVQFRCTKDESEREPSSEPANACILSATPANNFGASQFFTKKDLQ